MLEDPIVSYGDILPTVTECIELVTVGRFIEYNDQKPKFKDDLAAYAQTAYVQLKAHLDLKETDKFPKPSARTLARAANYHKRLEETHEKCCSDIQGNIKRLCDEWRWL